MTIHRFFILPDAIQQSMVVFPGDVAHQITNVLRLRSGEQVVVLDGTSSEYTVELLILGKNSVMGKVLSQRENDAEPLTHLTLYQSLISKDKFELVLQKGTEVGVSTFVPIETKRSIVKS